MTLVQPVKSDRRPAEGDRTANFAQALFQELLTSSLVLAADWDKLSASQRATVAASRDEEALLQKLADFNLLTAYQASRLRAGKDFGLVLGNYRVLDRLGAGGMGVIYLAEHIRMRRRVAIKTLAWTTDQDSRLVSRFDAEMLAVARLHHQNIVSPIDVGEVRSPDPDVGTLHYFVMEYLQGQDLEVLIQESGPLAADRACQIMRGIADALHEAHSHQLIHRDIKPSNVVMMPDGSAKLLDFGLARTAHARLTEPGSVLGTLGYMAPEQAQDATTVDERADIYSLGATLFWTVTGQDPFPLTSNVAQDLHQRLTQPPPSARAIRSDVPARLDEVINKMMAVAAGDRYPTAQAVMRALLPFCQSRGRNGPMQSLPGLTSPRTSAGQLLEPRAHHRVLVVDDEPGIRTFCALALRADGIASEEAADGAKALESLAGRQFDLVLLDIDMPNLSGIETLKRLREAPPNPNLKVVMFSGRSTADDMAHLLTAGADDFLPKPFTIVQLRARVKAALRLKDAQDRSDLLNRHLLTLNADLERNLTSKDSDLVGTRNALVLGLAKLVENRNSENGSHVIRIQRLCRALGEEALAGNDFGPIVNPDFVQSLSACAPLHDIGKVGLPDHILLKPGKFDREERLQMQTHTTVGAETLEEVAQLNGLTTGFLHMAADIARSHHERFDGTGYPDRLAGDEIPLPARFVAVADVYDALRSRRVYKPPLPHHTAIMTMMEGSPGQFDPKLLKVLQRCAPQFEQIFRECGD